MRTVSIGFNCNPALCLRGIGLGAETMPFDWLVTTPDMIRNIVAARFAGFADAAQWSSSGMLFDMSRQVFLVPGRKSKFYHTRFGPIWIHDGNPSADVQAKYRRRADRFMAVLEDTEPVLFVFGGKPSPTAADRNDHRIEGDGAPSPPADHTTYGAQLRGLRDFLAASFPRLPFHILGLNVEFHGSPKTEEDRLSLVRLGSFHDRPHLERSMRRCLQRLLVTRVTDPKLPGLAAFLAS